MSCILNIMIYPVHANFLSLFPLSILPLPNEWSLCKKVCLWTWTNCILNLQEFTDKLIQEEELSEDQKEDFKVSSNEG